MNSRARRQFLIALGALFLIAVGTLVSACGGGTRGTTDTSIEVRGILVDSSGQPLSGVPVKAGEQSALTDAQGEFQLFVEPGQDQVSFVVANTEFLTSISPVVSPVLLSFKVNSENSAVTLIGETPLDEEATPTPAPTNTAVPAQNTPAPTPTAQPSPTATSIPAQLSLSLNKSSFSSFQTAIFTISALGGSASPLNGNSIVLVLGTLGTGQTSLTFANNVTVNFPTSSSDIYFILSIQNYVQTMQNGSVVFSLPVDVVSAPATLFAKVVAVEPGTNALLAQSAQINFQLVPTEELE